MKKIFWTVSCFLILTSTACAEGFVLIVNKANTVASVSKEEVQSIFLGKKNSWAGGQSIKPVLQKDSSVHEEFVRTLVGKTSQQFDNYWKKAIFTGTGAAPESLKDDQAVKSFVAGNRGAVGYISTGALDESVRKLEVR